MSKVDDLLKQFGDDIDESLGKRTMAELRVVKGTSSSDLNQGRKRATGFFDIELDRIIAKEQVRPDFKGIEELAKSIQEVGLLNPIVVRFSAEDNAFVLVAGERRFRAVKLAGMHSVCCRVQNVDELRALEIQLIENVQRDDLDAVAEARGYRKLMELASCSARDVAKKVGKHESTITRALRLLDYPADIQAAISSGQIKKSVARELARIDDEELLGDYLQLALAGQLSVADAVEAVSNQNSKSKRVTRTRLAKPKRQLVFDGGDGFEVVITYKTKPQVRDLKYVDIERAFENVLAEVRGRRQLDLKWDAQPQKVD